MTGTEIAVHDEPQSGSLALRGDQVEFSAVQRAALEHIGIADAPEGDQQVFMHVAQRTGLDMFAKQIYMIGRNERQPNGSYKKKWTIQTGIDGFRLIAERHPQYRGQVGPQWCGTDGVWRDVWLDPQRPPAAARVGVLRGDRAEPVWGVALFREYSQSTTVNGQQQLTKMWREKGAHMVAKCAEALAVRRAFPQEIGGLVTDDEMGAADRRAVAATSSAPAPGITAAELTGRQVVDADPEPEPETAPEPDPDPAGGDTDTSSRGKRPAEPDGEAPAAAAPSGGSESPRPGPDDEPVADDEQPTEPRAKPVQLRQLGALFGEAEVADTDRHHVTGLLIGAEVTSWSTLTVAQAQTATDELKRLKRSGHPDGLRGAVVDLMRADEQERMESELAADTVDGEVVNEDQAAAEQPTDDA